jgi:hypothetical protein
MKIEYRLPSKSVQYGYVNVDGTAEELASVNYTQLGMDYMSAVRRYWEGEIQGLEHLIKADDAQPQQVIDLPSNETSRTNLARTPMREVETVDLPEADAEKLITEELGATKISEEVYDEPVSEAPKPWAAPSVFDFED